MLVSINDRLHDVPFDLIDIPLGKYLEFYEQYGRELDKELTELTETDYRKRLKELGYSATTEADIELHMSLDMDNHLDKEALSWFSFWTGHDIFGARDLPGVTTLLSKYRIFRYITSDKSEETEAGFPHQVLWKDAEWMIQDYNVTPASDMDFNEVITSKEVMRQINAIGGGKWDSLPYLCAVFFRKKGEPFSDALIAEGGERLTLMQELPMLYAMQVAFFLSICVTIWRNISVYSPNEAAVTPSPN